MLPSKQKLIIVPADKHSVHANLLRTLISSKDDKNDSEDGSVGTRDGEVEAVIWDDKHYEANKNTLSSEQNVLFIGKSKRTANDIEALSHFKVEDDVLSKFDEYERFGINFYISGNSAAIIVDKKKTSDEEYEKFYEFCVKNDKKIQERIDMTNSESDGERNNLAKGLLSFANPVVSGAASVGSLAKNMAKNYGAQKKIQEQKETASVQIFYMHHLQDFLDN